MKVLVVGSGGREHAICTAVAKSPRVDKIYCAPGNAGIAAIAECVAIQAMEFEKLAAFAKENVYTYTFVIFFIFPFLFRDQPSDSTGFLGCK